MIRQFEDVLKARGIVIAPGSHLERICIRIMDWERQRKGLEPINLMEDVRKPWSEALGLWDLVRHITDLSSHPGFDALIPHLALLNKGSAPQNVVALQDEASNKVFELLIGLISLRVGKDVSTDDPNHSKGDNPDVIVTLEEKRWGLACKVLNGFSPLTMFERLEEGVNQIENSPKVETGCVVFNLKNVLDHNLLWPILNLDQFRSGKLPYFAAWPSLDCPLSVLLEVAGQKHRDLVEVNTEPELRKLFHGKKATPGALLFLQTGTALRTSVGPLMTSVGVFVYMDLFETGQCPKALNLLNYAMHHRPVPTQSSS
ncbi:MAG: hypothetical protein PCFJNLEI_01727 [Verrucomicrobiae bacterium]|nr:hypothetical protein [Verrucomicrobiae bacterium]